MSEAPSLSALRRPRAEQRFERRWRLVGGGLSNVWRFGNLDFPAESGRLLLRGANGTGKTTAMEGLWPYLLDLNAQKLAAGKSRTTSLPSLMREGDKKRRTGYVWLTFESPHEGVRTFGVRLEYSKGASPQVKSVPFTLPCAVEGEELSPPGKDSMTGEQFATFVGERGGEVFQEHDVYLRFLATRLFGTPDVKVLELVAQRVRHGTCQRV